jgi:hypothetical protein
VYKGKLYKNKYEGYRILSMQAVASKLLLTILPFLLNGCNLFVIEIHIYCKTSELYNDVRNSDVILVKVAGIA